MNIIITSPSLDPSQNVSGISSVTQFIIDNNKEEKYIHFELGRKDNEKGGISRILPIIKNILKWNKLLSKYPQTIIHYNFPLSKASILRDPLFIWIAQIKKHKMVIHVHGGVFLTAPHIPAYLNIILRKIFSLPIPFIVLSELEKKILKDKFRCYNISVLPNCVDLKDAIPFQRIPNDKDTLVIGYLGRIAETKGMSYLLEACVKLKEKKIPFILKLAGKEEVKDQYLPLFKEKLGNQFIYEGVVFGDKKTSFLKSLDIFILPSFFEGLPMSLIECMSFGVVPITTNVGSIGEIVENENNGLFIPVKDSTTIAQQIEKINTNRDLLHNLSQNAKNHIINHFSAQQYIITLNNIYTSTISIGNKQQN